jgi:hypothetical protein
MKHSSVITGQLHWFKWFPYSKVDGWMNWSKDQELTLANRVHNTSTRFHIDHFCPPQLNHFGVKCLFFKFVTFRNSLSKVFTGFRSWLNIISAYENRKNRWLYSFLPHTSTQRTKPLRRRIHTHTHTQTKKGAVPPHHKGREQNGGRMTSGCGVGKSSLNSHFALTFF